MIKRRHTKLYESNILSNKVEYSIAIGSHCKTHDVKALFYMPGFSSSNIISNQFHVDKNEGESVISYDMIIGCDLMVNLGLLVDFNNLVIQWDGDAIPMK